VAMLNMDMIGRNGRDSIFVGGRDRSADLSSVVDLANGTVGMTITAEPEDLYYRSDQASFAAHRIPALSFSSGLHADYHKVSDEVDRIDGAKIARVAALVFRVAWLAGDASSSPSYDGPQVQPEVLISSGEHHN